MSSKNRLKHSKPVLRSRADAEAVLGQIRDLTIERNTAQAAREADLKRVDDQYAAPMDALAKDLDEKVEQLRVWAEANPAEFGGKKSVELTHGTMGFRVGQPTLKALAGWTWDRVLDVLGRTVGGKDYVRTKLEVDKQRLLADRETLGTDGLRTWGVRVVQDEPFFVEPKLDEPQPARLKEAV